MKPHNQLPFILFKYFTKDILKYFLMALITFILLILFIDIIELFRRSANKVGVEHLAKATFIDILGMASLKIPSNIEKVIPFSVLIGSIACFNQWRKKSYYIISRTFGISLWRLIFPILIVLFTIGIFSIGLLNPISTIFNKKYDTLQAVFFGEKNLKSFSFDTKGFWITNTSKDKKFIINAKKIDDKNKMLHNINIFILSKNREIEKRIIAESGRIFLNSIELYKVHETSREKQLTKLKQLILPIKISSNNISIAIANPQTIYILDLPLYIYTMKKYGLNTSRHLIYLYKLICQPLLIVAMILLSAAIMLRSSERKIQIGIISYSLVVGFSLYFIGDIIFALGTNDRLPALLSGFGPTLIGLFSGCYLISDMDSSKKLIMKTKG